MPDILVEQHDTNTGQLQFFLASEEELQRYLTTEVL